MSLNQLRLYTHETLGIFFAAASYHGLSGVFVIAAHHVNGPSQRVCGRLLHGNLQRGSLAHSHASACSCAG